eukprot:jgi/Mesvir1/19220/Mv11528-RA.3
MIVGATYCNAVAIATGIERHAQQSATQPRCILACASRAASQLSSSLAKDAPGRSQAVPKYPSLVHLGQGGFLTGSSTSYALLSQGKHCAASWGLRAVTSTFDKSCPSKLANPPKPQPAQACIRETPRANSRSRPDNNRNSQASKVPPRWFGARRGLLTGWDWLIWFVDLVARAWRRQPIRCATLCLLCTAFFLSRPVQASAARCVEQQVLAPASSVLSEVTGRHINLGRVKRITPFNVQLSNVHVGPSNDEFSRVVVPDLDLRLKPLLSLSRRQVVLEAFVRNPSLIVSQACNLSWANIPETCPRPMMRPHWVDNGNGSPVVPLSLVPGHIDAEARLPSLAKKNKGVQSTDMGRPAGKGAVSWHTSLMPTGPGSSTGQPSTQTDHLGAPTGNGFARMVEGAVLNAGQVVSAISSATMIPARETDAHTQGAGSASGVRAFVTPASAFSAAAGWAGMDQDRGTPTVNAGDTAVGRALRKAFGNSPPGAAAPSGDSLDGNSSQKGPAQSQQQQQQRESLPPVWLERALFTNGNFIMVPFEDTFGMPRVVKRVEGSVRLDPGCQHFTVDFVGQAVERDMGASPRVVTMSKSREREEVPVSSRVGGKVDLEEERRREWAVRQGGDGGRLALVGDIQPFINRWTINLSCDNLHAPLLERILDVPFDIYDGRLDGKILISANNGDPFPFFGGKLQLRGGHFHVFEAPADFEGVNMDAMLQRQALYFLKATGNFGAIPIMCTGDMDLNVQGGEYRLHASVSAVEVNELMDTFGAMPPPYPVAGWLGGVVHMTGPLEKPFYTGIAGARTSIDDDAMPTSVAKSALFANPGTVMSYDRVPFVSASTVFSYDSGMELMQLHAIDARPLGGGAFTGRGTLHIGPNGEADPNAVQVELTGAALPADDVLRRYATTVGAETPPYIFGATNAKVTMSGCLLSPALKVAWESPQGEGPLLGASGTVSITPEAMQVSSSAPSFDLVSKLHTFVPPPLEPGTLKGPNRLRGDALRRMVYARRPAVEGCDLDLKLNGFDLVPLATDEPILLPDLQALKMNVSGNVKFKGWVPVPAFPVHATTPASGPLTTGTSASRQTDALGDAASSAGGPMAAESFSSSLASSPTLQGVSNPPSSSKLPGAAASSTQLQGNRDVTDTSSIATGSTMQQGEFDSNPDIAAAPLPPGEKIQPAHTPPERSAPQIRPRVLGPRSVGRAVVAGALPATAIPVSNNSSNAGLLPAGAKGKALPASGFTELVGNVNLSGMRLNQMLIGRELSGRLEMNSEGVKLIVKGRPDEHLMLEMRTNVSANADDASLFGGSMAKQQASPRKRTGWQGRGIGFPSTSSFGSDSSGPNLDRKPSAPQDGSAQGGNNRGSAIPDIGALAGSLSFRRGQMRTDVSICPSYNYVELRNIPLDEMEVASLRGVLERLTMDLDFRRRRGGGNLSIVRPRFSGIQGKSLDASFKWAGDVFTLNKSTLRQDRGSYEFEGQYVLPSMTQADREAVVSSLRNIASGRECGGTWKVKVAVPEAEISEMLPAVSLLMDGVGGNPARFTRARQLFLDGVKRMEVISEGFQEQLDRVSQQLSLPQSLSRLLEKQQGGRPEDGEADASDASSSARSQKGQKGPAEARALPGLQDLRGQWKGSLQASGSADGTTPMEAEFQFAGRGWVWGDNPIQRITLDGGFHTDKGLELKQFRVDSVNASLRVQGDLLGPKQNAIFSVVDFPASVVQPLATAISSTIAKASPAPPQDTRVADASNNNNPSNGATTNAANATIANGAGTTAGVLSGSVTNGVHGNGAGHAGIRAAGARPAGTGPGPAPPRPRPYVNNNSNGDQEGSKAPPAMANVSGYINMFGHLGGTVDAPECEVDMRLIDGQLSGVSLQKAEAKARLGKNQRLDFESTLIPGVGHGHVRVKGSVPLPTSSKAAAAHTQTEPAQPQQPPQLQASPAAPANVATSTSPPTVASSPAVPVSSILSSQTPAGTATASGPESATAVASRAVDSSRYTNSRAANINSAVDAAAPTVSRKSVPAGNGDVDARPANVATSQADASTADPDRDSMGADQAVRSASYVAELAADITLVSTSTAAEVELPRTTTEGAVGQVAGGRDVKQQAVQAQLQQQQATQQQPQQAPQQHVEEAALEGKVHIDASIKDSGMMLISGIIPDISWQQGNADINLRVSGTLDAPEVRGTASIHRAAFSSSFLPKSVQSLSCSGRIARNWLHIDSIEGRTGRKGHFHISGSLPLFHEGDGSQHADHAEGPRVSPAQATARLDPSGAESMAAASPGTLWSDDSLAGPAASEAQPSTWEGAGALAVGDVDDGRSSLPGGGVDELAPDGSAATTAATGMGTLPGGAVAAAGDEFVTAYSSNDVRVSMLSPQARVVEGATETSAGAKGAAAAGGAVANSSSQGIVFKASSIEVRVKNVYAGMFDAELSVTGTLVAPEVGGKVRLSKGTATLQPQDQGAATPSSQSAVQQQQQPMDWLKDTLGSPRALMMASAPVQSSSAPVTLQGLKLALGPELRLNYPVVINFAIEGEVELNGTGDPAGIQPKGTIRFQNGEINLLATQMQLKRDFPNRAEFRPENGMDPKLHLSLISADAKMIIDGWASNWQVMILVGATQSLCTFLF